MGELVKIWDKPILGRLFSVGDIHGSYSLLMNRLKEIGFDFEKDLLAAVGDLVDRGAQNLECIELLSQPWFTSVRGNHEDLCIGGMYDEAFKRCHIQNGGEWFYELDYQVRHDIANKFVNLPIVLEISHNGKKFGFVHGHIEENHWEGFKQTFNTLGKLNASQRAMWCRDRLDPEATAYSHVHGVDAVIMGHTVTSRPCKRDNCIFIDTGAVHNGNLTIIELG